MFVRIVFLLLLALNVAVAGWLLFGHSPRHPPVPASDPGVPVLKLLSEAPVASAATGRAPPASPTPAASVAPATAASVTTSPALAQVAVDAAAAAARNTSAEAPPRASASLSARPPAALPTAAASASAPSPPPATTGPAPAPAASVASAAAGACFTLGPFTASTDMRAAMATLGPHVARIQYREEEVRRSHGYWVYLPATATREEALGEARKLAAKGLRDYYVVSAGDSANTISLGLYNDEANARNRVAQLRKDGFAPELRQRMETEPAYWIDYAVAAGGLDWRKWLGGRTDLQARQMDCF